MPNFVAKHHLIALVADSATDQLLVRADAIHSAVSSNVTCPHRKCHPVGERRSGDPAAQCGTFAICFGRCSSDYSDRARHLKPRTWSSGSR